MILETRAAKNILIVLAFVLLGCAVFVWVTDWGDQNITVNNPATEASSPQPPSSPMAIDATSQPTFQGHPVSNSSDQTPVSTPSPSPKPTVAENEPISQPIEGIYIDPLFQQSRAGEVVVIDICAKLSGTGISGAELKLAFDSSALQVLDLKPGPLLGTSPLIGTEQIDNQSGLVHYALARKGPTDISDSSGIIATIQCETSDSQPGKICELKLTEIKLTDQDFKGITDLDVRGGSIKISPWPD